MKTLKKSVVLAIVAFSLFSCSDNECIMEWNSCRANCPTEEESAQEYDRCVGQCAGEPIGKEYEKCRAACLRKTREHCLATCDRQLRECVGY